MSLSGHQLVFHFSLILYLKSKLRHLPSTLVHFYRLTSRFLPPSLVLSHAARRVGFLGAMVKSPQSQRDLCLNSNFIFIPYRLSKLNLVDTCMCMSVTDIRIVANMIAWRALMTIS